MRGLSEYLDAFDERPRGVRLGGVRVTQGDLGLVTERKAPPQSRGLGAGLLVNPVVPVVTTTPQVSALFTRSILPIYQASAKAEVDAAMWSLDSRWRPQATWASLKTCVGVQGGPMPASDPRLQTPTGPVCQNYTGANLRWTCDWGFWRLSTCSLDTATQSAFQYPRYLWAQTRMREHLANKPVPGATSWQTAADWAWEAQQYISVLLWATNARFDSGTGRLPADPHAEFKRKGLLDSFAGDPVNGPGAYLYRDGHVADESGLPSLSGASIPATRLPGTTGAQRALWTLETRVFNYVRNGASVPLDKNAFSPMFRRYWNDPTDPDRGPRMNSLVYGRAFDSPLVLPFNLSDVRSQVDRAPEAEKDKVVFRRWFEISWGYDAPWMMFPYPVRRQSIEGGPYTLYTTTAQWIIDDLAAKLTRYSDPMRTYFDWLETAVLVYDANTQQVLTRGTATAGIDFLSAKRDMLAAAQAGATAQRAAASRGSGGDVAAAVQIGVTLVVTIASLFLPVVGVVFSAFTTGMRYAADLFFDLYGSADDGPCAALPFIRIMAPETGGCDISVTDVVTSLLGIDSVATWPVRIGGQTLTFAVDGHTFLVTFGTADTDAASVARRINSVAALVGLGPVALVRAGQVHVEGQNPAEGAVRVLSGTATALGFPRTAGGDGPIMLNAEQRRALIQATATAVPLTTRQRELVRTIPITLVAGTLDPVTLCAPGETPNPATGICGGPLLRRDETKGGGGGALFLGAAALGLLAFFSRGK